ncbi:hypothetical protein F4802DRAFT_529876 [Xylaria palmicola]|nr:hypothetical protein F4802DRAFT_529876 [Xylaria palmicola]
MRHTRGYYFAMRFDSSITTQEEVRKMLRLDPRMIRHSSVKLGDGKLGTMSRLVVVMRMRNPRSMTKEAWDEGERAMA